jgi:glycosyltransferase involved in cell wall biosynthesis
MTRRDRRADVAVYAPLAGPLYEHGGEPVGGAELQSAYLARALVEQGLRVRHVVAAKDAVSRGDGVEVLLLPSGYSAGGVARRRAILSALREANSRLYVQRSAGFETLAVGLFARAARRRFVFSSSSVADFTRDPEVAVNAGASLDEWPTRVQYLAGLRFADAVVVQSDEQRVLAAGERGIDSRVIRSFCPAVGSADGNEREAFLWIGGLIGSKDPLAYVELARRVPEATFWMVAGGRGDTWAKLADEVRFRSASVPNLHFLQPAGRDDLLGLYGRAVAVVSTSRFEGFPNTFLEGWARGTPSLSLRVDPDSVIERNELGTACGGSLEALAAATRRLWSVRHEIDPEPLRAYVARVHDPSVVGPHWAALVRELVAR